jgi:hypothetical protein
VRAAIGRVTATSYDMIRRSASKSTDDVVVIKTEKCAKTPLRASVI